MKIERPTRELKEIMRAQGYITVQEAAGIARVHRTTLGDYARDKRIKSRRVNRYLFIWKKAAARLGSKAAKVQAAPKTSRRAMSQVSRPRLPAMPADMPERWIKQIRVTVAMGVADALEKFFK